MQSLRNAQLFARLHQDPREKVSRTSGRGASISPGHKAPNLVVRTAIACLLFAAFPDSRAVEAPPEAGTILRAIKPEPALPPKSVAPIRIPEQESATADSAITFEVKGWRITGATLFPEATLLELLKNHIGKAVSLAELRKAAQDVSRFYQEQGYFARAVLPAQEIRDGVVELVIREAQLGKIDVESGADVFRGDRARLTVLAAHPEGETLRMKELERGILLLNDLPGVIASSTLKPGRRAGESDLGLKIDPTRLLSGSLDYANAGVDSVGMNQFGGFLALNNPFRIGDLASLRLQGGSHNVYGRIAYSLPVGYSGLKIGVAASGLYYELGAPFESLDAQGSAWTGGVFANYPLIRGVDTNLSVTSGFDDRRYYNTSLQSVISDKEVQVGYIGLSGDYRDRFLGGAINQYGVILIAGSLDLSANRADQQANDDTAKASGAYQKFILNFSRLQRVSDSFRLYAALTGQVATKNLDSSEKFSLGGPYGVRAYPVNEALGDEGYLMNFEMRYEVCERVELVGFIDHGGVRLHIDPWKGSNLGVPNTYTLSGGGVGINWIAPGDFAIRGSLAQRIGSNPAQNAAGRDSDGSYQTPHFWVSLSKYF